MRVPRGCLFGIRHHANALVTIKKMFKLGQGFSAVALATVQTELESGQLVHVRTEAELDPLLVHCIFQARHR
ncbi:hypothetical protein [Aliiruegeria lutimaris]|uniref:Uncharacterized protein n=1 Tax=Aliiruegeria lutimaris TaxID=571298 RepID=A0A1G8W8Q8_9RHOB|nr:hypothetical protein [Aliiruegeria lutimaris]SDJ74672.1 hypothetical protein SAMN04488026_102348 [Aliiruegeria lutimaris]